MRLANGTVLPSGLLSQDTRSGLAGFNKTYKNFALRAGIVIASYDVDSKKNVSKILPEYDILVIEQDENRGITPVTYRNCIMANGFGGIGDYLEYRLRPQKKKTNKKLDGKDFAGQDGSIVLILCLDGVSEKAIIVGGLQHPERKTKLKGKDQILAGEFNGMAISIADDGSANLTFKGATENDGTPKDKSQGNTTIDIEKDGTLQFKNKGATYRMEKAGNVLLQNIGTATIDSKKTISVKSGDKLNVEAKDTSFKVSKLVLESQGSASLKASEFQVSGESKIDLKSKMISLQGDSSIQIKAAQITLDGMVSLGGAGGTPAVTMNTMGLGIGNQGIPVSVNLIGPFSSSVMIKA